MANHTITLNATEESIYQAYLIKTGQTDEVIMGKLKDSLSSQVIQTINEAGRNKFEGMSVAEKIAFVQS